MKNERIIQLRERINAIMESKNVTKEELFQVSLELDRLIEENLEKRIAM